MYTISTAAKLCMGMAYGKVYIFNYTSVVINNKSVTNKSAQNRFFDDSRVVVCVVICSHNGHKRNRVSTAKIFCDKTKARKRE